MIIIFKAVLFNHYDRASHLAKVLFRATKPVRYCTAIPGIKLMYNTVLYSILVVLHCKVLCRELYCTVLYCTVVFGRQVTFGNPNESCV
jgi:hypothetical protein